MTKGIAYIIEHEYPSHIFISETAVLNKKYLTSELLKKKYNLKDKKGRILDINHVLRWHEHPHMEDTYFSIIKTKDMGSTGNDEKYISSEEMAIKDLNHMVEIYILLRIISINRFTLLLQHQKGLML